VHELSLCHHIAGIAERARDGRSVIAVHVRVGQLRQVVPETLVWCWGMVTEDTPLAGSRLEVDHVPVVVDCASCGATTTLAHALVLTCGDCESGETSIRTGEELLVTTLDLAPATVPTAQET